MTAQPERWPTNWPLHSPGGKVFGRFIVFLRTDARFVVFDPWLPLGKDAGVFNDPGEACDVARELAAEVSAAPKVRPLVDWDAESFAGMKRAMVNGFAPHPPAWETPRPKV